MSTHTLDVRGLACPIPVTRAAAAIERLAAGELLEVLATDPEAAIDIPAWAARAGHAVVALERDEDRVRVVVCRA